MDESMRSLMLLAIDQTICYRVINISILPLHNMRKAADHGIIISKDRSPNTDNA